MSSEKKDYFKSISTSSFVLEKVFFQKKPLISSYIGDIGTVYVQKIIQNKSAIFTKILNYTKL